MKKNLIKIVLLAFFLAFFTAPAKADDLLDLQNQINQKNSNLSSTSASLDKIKKDIASLSGGLAGTKAQLDQALVQVENVKNELQTAEANLEKERKTLAYLINIRDDQIRMIYQYPQRTPLELFLTNQNMIGFTENLSYQSQVVTDSHSLIKLVNSEVTQMETTQKQLQDSKSDLEILIAALNARYSAQKQSLANSYYLQTTVSKNLDMIKSDITRALIRQGELDAQRRAGNPNGAPSVPVNPGPSGTTYYFFYGTGNYWAMGHGIGMSQWGAYGYAKNLGWTGAQILQKYYTGATVTGYNQPSQIRVVGSCYNGGGEQIIDFNTYIKGISELLSSWETNPTLVELMKAQVIAARTYAINQVNGKGFVYGDTRDQCWTGNTSRPYWNQAVDATQGQVLTANGGLVNTLYSASHGGHSENNENVFQGWNGNGYVGYPLSYLRGVSDADSGGVGPSDNYQWNTKYSYTISQVRDILRLSLSGGENSWIDNSIGNLTGLGVERGVSSRVAWVVLYGDRGTVKIPGMVFWAAFNKLSAAPVNKDDVMYSVNFSIGNQVK